MKTHFLKLLNYNTWANRRFLSCVQDNTVVNNKVFLLLSHLLTAEEVWLCRVKGVVAPIQRLWELYPNATLPIMLEENSSQWIAYLNNSSEADFDQEAAYKDSKGELFRTRLDDIITHMVNHGSHHRAQIASLLKHEKIQPPASDYIVYIRELKPALV